jgi:hypothetical protein
MKPRTASSEWSTVGGTIVAVGESLAVTGQLAMPGLRVEKGRNGRPDATRDVPFTRRKV